MPLQFNAHTMDLDSILLSQNALSAQALEAARQVHAANPLERMASILVRTGAVSEQTLLQALAELHGAPIFSANAHPQIADQVRAFVEARGIAPRILTQYGVLMWQEADQPDAPVQLAVRDPGSAATAELTRFVLHPGERIAMCLLAARDLERICAEVLQQTPGLISPGGPQDLRKLAEDAPIVELVNSVLSRANDSGASDVHIVPHEYGFVVRYRIDGVLQSADEYTRDRFDAVVSRIKLISGLDIAERRMPQDGRFSARAAGVETDVRVSVIPGSRGESLVLRLLPNQKGKRFILDALGFESDHLQQLQAWLHEPDGIILVTGPTGSGKSTTLYSALEACDLEHERVLTVEDPVEYQVNGVTQFQVNADIGFTFPAALRSILRHDPDIIMIGEIRDTETARIAIQASLTGHKVLSTLHTNDSATAFLRLTDMGVESFLVGATVRGVIAQRLVRRLCDACAVPLDDRVPETIRQSLRRLAVPQEAWTFRRSIGCQKCHGSGYKGRMAVYEFLEATQALRTVLAQERPSHQALLDTVGKEYRTLREDALLKAVRGVTSLEEVMALAGPAVAVD